MSNHLTPTELAHEAGLDRKDVISKCVEWGVPIFEGKIDKTLFSCARKEMESSSPSVGKVVTA